MNSSICLRLTLILFGFHIFYEPEVFISDNQDFLSSTPQTVNKRTIAGNLISEKKINLSEEKNLYRLLHLGVIDDKITVFDQSEFGFYQFNFDLQCVNKYGSEGQGPGELLNAIDFHSSDSRYYTLDNRLSKITIHSKSGNHIKDLSAPFGVIPHRFTKLDDERFALLSVVGRKAFHIMDTDGNLENSFLSIEGISMNKKAFLLEGRVAGKDGILFYGGFRNSMLKAYTEDGEVIFSRRLVEPLDHDILNMEDHEIRTADAETLDLIVIGRRILLLTAGSQTDEKRWRYLDIYDSNTGDYIETYILETFTRKISLSNDGKFLVALGYYNNTDEMALKLYRLPI